MSVYITMVPGQLKKADSLEELFEQMPQVSYWRASGWDSFSDI